jgi:hypothetical protein
LEQGGSVLVVARVQDLEVAFNGASLAAWLIL